MRDNWTPQAIDCYNRHCRCEGCNAQLFMEQKCQMKYAVIKLVSLIGTPPVYDCILPGAKEYEQRVVKAILDGYTTKKAIAKHLGLCIAYTQRCIDGLCVIVQTMGYVFIKQKNRLPELVEILKEIENDTRNE